MDGICQLDQPVTKRIHAIVCKNKKTSQLCLKQSPANTKSIHVYDIKASWKTCRKKKNMWTKTMLQTSARNLPENAPGADPRWRSRGAQAENESRKIMEDVIQSIDQYTLIYCMCKLRINQYYMTCLSTYSFSILALEENVDVPGIFSQHGQPLRTKPTGKAIFKSGRRCRRRFYWDFWRQTTKTNIETLGLKQQLFDNWPLETKTVQFWVWNWLVLATYRIRSCLCRQHGTYRLNFG